MQKFRKMYVRFFIAAFLATAGVSLAHAAVPWPLLPRVTILDQNKKNELREVLSMESNYGECREKILECLSKEKPDMIAVRIANFCAYLLDKGVPPHELWVFIKERAKFANEEKPHSFDYLNSPILGNPKAAITITEFAEFKCPHCVHLGPILKKLVAESNGTVRLVFKHFPLKIHEGSVTVSKVAQAAYRQGKFWEMYDLLYEDFDRHDIKDPVQYARQLGLDVQRFKADMEDPELVALIERDKMEGVKAGVRGTPTLFINGKQDNLRYDEDFLKDLLDEEAEHLGISPPYKDWSYGVQK
jgi:predicted DsbA family dithiol-disulfide isomerase